MTAGLPRSRRWRDARTPPTRNLFPLTGGRFTHRSGEEDFYDTNDYVVIWRDSASEG